ncbi:MAG: hypothetical protein WC280_02475 [Patescibacteria group bacterium]
MTLGIALISFNRGQYFKQTIKSLENQVKAGEVDYHLFQDGAVNKFSHALKSRPELISQSIRIFDRANLKRKIKHISEMNIGNALNQFRAIEFMSQYYDYFLIIEDDVVLSKYYLRLIRVMIEQFLSENDVFSVALNFKRMCEKSKIKENLDKAGYNLKFPGANSLHWWAECFSSEKWQRAKPYFLDYIKLVENCDYQRRPAQKIKELFYRSGMFIAQTSQDAGKDYAIKMAGMKRVNTIVNRGFYIGQIGLHFNPALYNKMEYASQKPFEFKSDLLLNSFNICDKNN